MANRPLTEAELLEIIENDEFWEDLQSGDGCSSNKENVLHAAEGHSSNNEERLRAAELIFDYGEGSDTSESDCEETSCHDTDSEMEWEPSCDEYASSEAYDDTGTEPEEQEEIQIEAQEPREVQINTQEQQELQKRDHQAFYGKDRTKWLKNPKTRGRTTAKNIVVTLPGLKGTSKQNPPSSVTQSWNIIFTEDMCDMIVQYTNRRIENVQARYSTFKKRKNSRQQFKPSFISKTSNTEVKAFIGLMYLSGLFKSGHEDLKGMWATDGTGREIFRCTMPLARFLFLFTCLRFDDEQTREERRMVNKFAPISELFDKFVENCKNNFNPGINVTIDEMLVPFRGRCGFRMYIPNKPAKYGMKIQIMADSKTHYMVNAEPYTGAAGVRTNKKKNELGNATKVVLRLVQPISNTGRNITTDNWYTSAELANELLKQKLTLVGTVNKRKTFIPPEFLPQKKREEQESVFGFQSELTLVSYVPKRNKSVVLLSSMHNDKAVDEETKKPDIVLFYNSTKGGVDALDQKCANYSTSRRTRRWPMAIFSMILNVSAVNARVLYQFSPLGKEIKRSKYIKELGIALCQPLIRLRVSNPKVSRKLRDVASNIFKIDIERPVEALEVVTKSKRKRCSLCPAKQDRKTNINCAVCKNPICLQCAKKVCINCL